MDFYLPLVYQLYQILDGYRYFLTETANHLVYSIMQYQYHNIMNCSALNTLNFDELVQVTQPQNTHDHGNSAYVLI